MKISYITEAPLVKASIATASLFSHTIANAVCGVYPLFCGYLAWIPDQLAILVSMMTLDIISGVLASRQQGERITSKKMSFGIARKIMCLTVLGMAVLLEQLFAVSGIPLSGNLFKWTATWFIMVEALSLYENAERGGLPMPPFLKTAMTWLLHKAGSGGTSSNVLMTLEESRGDETPLPPIVHK